MPNLKIMNYLQDHHIPYQTIMHKSAYTAQEIAALAHIPGKMMAKTVMLKMDGRFIMLVEPANRKVDLAAMKQWLGAKWVELAHEYEFEHMFPECDTGAMPPFGELFDVDVYIDDELCQQDDIAFNAGNHNELIRMHYSDFERLVKPKHVRMH